MFFAAETVAGVEPAAHQQRAAPDGGAAGHKAEHRGTGQAGRGIERAVAHALAGGIELSARLDEHARSEQAKPRPLREQAGRPGKRAGRPPRIVVAECHQRCPRRLGAQRPRAGPASRSQRITRTRGCRRATAAAVPSAEALSTTAIGGRSGSASRRESVARSRSRRSRVAMTTVGASTRQSRETSLKNVLSSPDALRS
jgi:hypothetical protein